MGICSSKPPGEEFSSPTPVVDDRSMVRVTQLSAHIVSAERSGSTREDRSHTSSGTNMKVPLTNTIAHQCAITISTSIETEVGTPSFLSSLTTVPDDSNPTRSIPNRTVLPRNDSFKSTPDNMNTLTQTQKKGAPVMIPVQLDTTDEAFELPSKSIVAHENVKQQMISSNLYHRSEHWFKKGQRNKESKKKNRPVQKKGVADRATAIDFSALFTDTREATRERVEATRPDTPIIQQQQTFGSHTLPSPPAPSFNTVDPVAIDSGQTGQAQLVHESDVVGPHGAIFMDEDEAVEQKNKERQKGTTSSTLIPSAPAPVLSPSTSATELHSSSVFMSSHTTSIPHIVVGASVPLVVHHDLRTVGDQVNLPMTPLICSNTQPTGKHAIAVSAFAEPASDVEQSLDSSYDSMVQHSLRCPNGAKWKSRHENQQERDDIVEFINAADEEDTNLIQQQATVEMKTMDHAPQVDVSISRGSASIMMDTSESESRERAPFQNLITITNHPPDTNQLIDLPFANNIPSCMPPIAVTSYTKVAAGFHLDLAGILLSNGIRREESQDDASRRSQTIIPQSSALIMKEIETAPGEEMKVVTLKLERQRKHDQAIQASLSISAVPLSVGSVPSGPVPLLLLQSMPQLPIAQSRPAPLPPRVMQQSTTTKERPILDRVYQPSVRDVRCGRYVPEADWITDDSDAQCLSRFISERSTMIEQLGNSLVKPLTCIEILKTDLHSKCVPCIDLARQQDSHSWDHRRGIHPSESIYTTRLSERSIPDISLAQLSTPRAENLMQLGGKGTSAKKVLERLDQARARIRQAHHTQQPYKPHLTYYDHRNGPIPSASSALIPHRPHIPPLNLKKVIQLNQEANEIIQRQQQQQTSSIQVVKPPCTHIVSWPLTPTSLLRAPRPSSAGRQGVPLIAVVSHKFEDRRSESSVKPNIGQLNRPWSSKPSSRPPIATVRRSNIVPNTIDPTKPTPPTQPTTLTMDQIFSAYVVPISTEYRPNEVKPLVVARRTENLSGMKSHQMPIDRPVVAKPIPSMQRPPTCTFTPLLHLPQSTGSSQSDLSSFTGMKMILSPSIQLLRTQPTIIDHPVSSLRSSRYATNLNSYGSSESEFRPW